METSAQVPVVNELLEAGLGPEQLTARAYILYPGTIPGASEAHSWKPHCTVAGPEIQCHMLDSHCLI